jgi:4-hydroxybenzoate polyprenyltransferase
MFFGFAMSAYHFFNFKASTQITILFTGGLSLLYPFGIRKIPFAKIFVISFVWAISTMLLLVLENNLVISQYIIWHLVSRFLFVFAITIPFDIRDLKYDADDLQTIPLAFGFEKAKWIAIFSLFICVIIAVFQEFHSQINSSNFLALMLLYLLASVLIKKSNENNSEMYFSFWVESLSIFSYLFLVILLLIFQIRLLTFTAL